MNFPEAWMISQSVPPEEHNPKCSTAQTGGAILCDCEVLTQHPRYIEDYAPDHRGGEMSDPITLSVPRHLHEVAFTSERGGWYRTRAFCKGCGWTKVADAPESDRLYWLARAHINEAPESVDPTTEGER